MVSTAEFIGFVVPACVGALTVDSPGTVAIPALLAAGVIEGGVLGAGQAMVLRRALPQLRPARWIAATAAGALLAYIIGLAPSTFVAVWSGWPVGLTAPVGIALGVALLCTIGVTQWTVLRRLVRRAGRWVVATAVAWLAGLAVFLGFVTPLWQPGQPLPVIVAIGVGGGLLMAVTMAAVTGMALRRLLPEGSTDPGTGSAVSPVASDQHVFATAPVAKRPA